VIDKEYFPIKSPRELPGPLVLFSLDQNHLRSPITSTATKVSSAAAKQQQ
jgi:hypothetical protein